jgi:hypothetical protein
MAMGLMYRRRRPIARLAVGAATAGIAYQAGKRRAERDRPEGQSAAGYGATRYEPAPQPSYVAPVPSPTGGEIDELARLVQMHASGALTDAEFTAAKAQLLGL